MWPKQEMSIPDTHEQRVAELVEGFQTQKYRDIERSVARKRIDQAFLSQAHDTALTENDPAKHAKVNAIREAHDVSYHSGCRGEAHEISPGDR